MKKLLYTVAAATLAVGLSAGAVSAAYGTVNTSGADAEVYVDDHGTDELTVDNTNDVTAENTNDQSATSGHATAEESTTAGDATTGDASNSNTLTAGIELMNNGDDALAVVAAATTGGEWNVETSGADAYVEVDNNHEKTATITNTNDLVVTNSSSQSATTGDAYVANNTTGGNAISGDATNTNTTSMTIAVSN